MNFSKQADEKIDKEQIYQMINRQRQLKKRRALSMSAIHAGEVLLLGGALSFPIGGWFLVVTLLGLGGIIFGTGYLSDKKIVNEYKELDNKIINAEENLVEQNSKILQKEEDTTRETIHQSKTKIKNKTTETEVVIDETKEI